MLLADVASSMGAEYELQIMNDMPSVETDECDNFVQLSLHTAQKYFYQSFKPQGANYYTDGSVYQPHLKLPILIYGPGEPKLAHQPNESVGIDKIASIRYYIALAIEYLGVKDTHNL